MLISIALAATTAVPAPNSAGGNELNTVIAAAANGDVLELASGTYCEGLVLADRVLTLRGQGDSATASQGCAVGANQITVTGGHLVLESLTVDGSNTTRALYVSSDTSVVVREATLTNGRAGFGGGAYVLGHLACETCSIASNTADSEGGGVFVLGDGSLTSSTGRYESNTASLGGGIATSDTARVWSTADTFQSNTADQDGGALHLSAQSQLWSAGMVCTGNIVDDDGGCLQMAFDSTATLISSYAVGNGAADEGGALRNNATGLLTVSGGELSTNTATRGRASPASAPEIARS
jgi:hypothetical protein